MSATSKGMTPEQKGDELIEKFFNTGHYASRSKRRATESAVIAEEEIIAAFEKLGWPTLWSAIQEQKEVLNYLKSKL